MKCQRDQQELTEMELIRKHLLVSIDDINFNLLIFISTLYHSAVKHSAANCDVLLDTALHYSA